MPVCAKPTNFTNGFLTIDLDSIAHNYRALKKYVGQSVEVCATVKSDAYGLGIEQVTPTLYHAGCHHFFVVHLDEALPLRRLLPEVYIYALAGLRPGIESYFEEYDIIPVLNCIDQIGIWAQYAQKKNKKLKAALHFDTGLNRYAIPHYEWDFIEKQSWMLKVLNIIHIMSHLACADEKNHPMNTEQLHLFQKIQKKWTSAAFYSLAASYGTLMGPSYHFNAIRPGKALLNPAPGLEELNLRSSTHLYAPILQIKKLAAHEAIGYGCTFVLNKPTRVATVGVGYGDGYHRALSNIGTVHINGKEAPIIGRVSMDFVTIDISHFEENEVKIGDYVEFFGTYQSLHHVAQKIGTISYELLTHLGKRYHRFYANSMTT